MQFLLVHASGDKTVTPTHCQLEMHMDNLPQETNKSPHGSDETKARSPTTAVPLLLSKTPVIRFQVTVHNLVLNRAQCQLTTLLCVELPLAPQRSCLVAGSHGPGLAFGEGIHISDGYN